MIRMIRMIWMNGWAPLELGWIGWFRRGRMDWMIWMNWMVRMVGWFGWMDDLGWMDGWGVGLRRN